MKISEELLQLIAAAGRGETIESSGNGIEWEEVHTLDTLMHRDYLRLKLRTKPKTITLAGVEFPEPLRVAPEMDTEFWLVDTPFFHKVARRVWYDGTDQNYWLHAGLLQVTEQGAKDQSKAMILSVGGSLE